MDKASLEAVYRKTLQEIAADFATVMQEAPAPFLLAFHAYTAACALGALRAYAPSSVIRAECAGVTGACRNIVAARYRRMTLPGQPDGPRWV